jgi:polyisoprenoid-binding protein YceI
MLASRLSPILGLSLFAFVIPAEALEFSQVQLDKSQITFVFKQMGVPVDGRFRKFNAQVAFDPAKPASSRAQVEIDLASIDAGAQEADDEVKSKNWFNIQQFPTAKFVSSAVKPLGGDRYEVAGKITIKGKTRDIVAPVSVKQEGNSALLDGAFTLKRLEYGVGAGPWSDVDTVADEVQIKFKLLVSVAK